MYPNLPMNMKFLTPSESAPVIVVSLITHIKYVQQEVPLKKIIVEGKHCKLLYNLTFRAMNNFNTSGYSELIIFPIELHSNSTFLGG